ncbi:hypothetical protein B0T09DRAFT_189801 [Sordaria sp. MPI-SDFR-AT-0083]|nr:hypothetical protein B0T09DRAFT_189801 [Sordaria sp. MPI-SDFR-AT-0083]
MHPSVWRCVSMSTSAQCTGPSSVHEMDSRSPSSPSFRSRASKRSGTRESVGHLFIQGVCYISASHTPLFPLPSFLLLFLLSFSSLITNSLLCLFTTSLSPACPPKQKRCTSYLQQQYLRLSLIQARTPFAIRSPCSA